MKRVIVFLLACFLILSSVSVSFAAAPVLSATKWCSPPSGFGGGSRVIPTDTVIPYSDLCDYRSSANRWLGSGMYPGFHGYATIVYTGSFYYIQLIQDGDTYWLCNSGGGRYRTRAEYKSGDTPTTVPSTTPPSIDNHESTESDNTYISDPISPSNSTTELSALNRLVQFTYSQIKAIHGLWRTNIKIYNIQIKLRSLMWNTIDGINNITTGIYKQVDLFNAYLPRLDDIYSRLSSIEAASWSSVDVQGRILSSVSGISSRLDALVTNTDGINFRLDSLVTNTDGINSRLDSVISNGVVQVGSASLEARLDKLISMYSKVNSVVLDTAAVNGGQIKDAVGGELKDVMFWGDTAKVDNTFVSSDGVAYSLNDVKTTVNGLTLRSLNLGSTIPSYIVDDPVLYAGVWRKGTDYIISDTYNASTGEYVKRIETFTFNRENLQDASYEIVSRGGSVYLFQLVLPIPWVCYNGSYDLTYYLHIPFVDGFKWGASTLNVDAYNDCVCVYHDGFVLGVNSSYLADDVFSSLVSRTPAMEMLFVPDPYFDHWVPSVQYFDLSTIAIPEGDSTISAEHLRITGKYETYDSYTQTADIIKAINNIPPYDDSGLIAAITGMTTPTVTTDLTEVTSRLDLILAELQSTSGSASCEHTYTQHMEQDADCILPGLMISTCSQCGDSYSEIVDPLGHDWVLSSHVDAVTDPDTGEETASAYDVYTCSRCGRTYEDHTGNGAPDEDYSNTSISQLVVQVFSKLGTFAGKLIGFFVHLLDKALTSVDNVISKFNDYTAQISSFGGSYPAWLTGFWGIIPSELQAALTFSVICMALGAVGKKLLFS